MLNLLIFSYDFSLQLSKFLYYLFFGLVILLKFFPFDPISFFHCIFQLADFRREHLNLFAYMCRPALHNVFNVINLILMQSLS